MHTVHSWFYGVRVTELLHGRRAANKARTRAAIVAAVFDLIDHEGVDGLTAERVADAAGLSRRTFFNYFESVEAVVAQSVEDALERLRAAVAQRPADESPLISALFVIEELFTTEFLAEATRIWRAVEELPSARRYALEAHDNQAKAFAVEWGRTRLDADGVDPLRAKVLTATVLAAFEEARRFWFTRHQGDVDDDARALFLAYVHQALETVRPAVDQMSPVDGPDSTGLPRPSGLSEPGAPVPNRG